MTVLLVLLTFGLFIGIDYLLSRRKDEALKGLVAKPLPAPAESIPAVTPHNPEPVWVAGYLMPEGLHYHVGHTWARVISPDTVVVGVDDFARQLMGSVTSAELPAVGTAVQQGAQAFQLNAEGERTAALVSPVSGSVIEVNHELATEPERIAKDPFALGWLVKIRCRELSTNIRNLLSGRLTEHWIEEARRSLELELMAFSGSVLQDGGVPVADFARHVSPEDWRRLTRDFFLT